MRGVGEAVTLGPMIGYGPIRLPPHEAETDDEHQPVPAGRPSPIGQARD